MRKMMMLAPALLLAASAAHAQAANPRGEAKLELGGQLISVDFGRPSLRGRDMIGQAEVGQTWRLGSDAATVLNTSAPLLFGKTEVAAGEHQLRARKMTAESWHLIVAGEGESASEVPFVPGKAGSSVEHFTIELTATGPSSGELIASWGTLVLKAPFSLKK